MPNRRELFRIAALAGAAAILPRPTRAAQKPDNTTFRFCLNTSTISGQKLELPQIIDITARAGYDGIELWVRDIRDWLNRGNPIGKLQTIIRDSGLTVENAIGFAEWMVDDQKRRKAGMDEMKSDMELMAQLGCHRIAAPPMGVEAGKPIDFIAAGQRYREVIELGQNFDIVPLMEFWGASGTVYQLGQALAIAAAANHPNARILADVYHLFRGNSGFDALTLVSGNAIELFHMNDYVSTIPREEQQDSDRVYPGDGAAPIQQIINNLKAMGGTKVLSLELFNRDYWQQEPLQVAKTGLQKIKQFT